MAWSSRVYHGIYVMWAHNLTQTKIGNMFNFFFLRTSYEITLVNGINYEKKV